MLLTDPEQIPCSRLLYFDCSDLAVLPELPLPTPLNQYGSGSILLHPGLEDSARHILQTPDHGLASRVAQALQAQPAEFLAPATAGATPTALALPLAQAVHQHNPQVSRYLLFWKSSSLDYTHSCFSQCFSPGFWSMSSPGSKLPPPPEQPQYWRGN